MKIEKVIKRPIISEKSTRDTAHSRFTFEVSLGASKYAIADAVKRLYKVDVLDVKTSLVPGKTKRVLGKRLQYKESKWKKAVVQVKEGQKIGLFEFGDKE